MAFATSNHKRTKTNKGLPKWVHRNKSGTFQARRYLNKKFHYLGTFKSPTAAYRAAKALG